MVFVKPKTRAPENGTRGTRWIRTKHIWSEKRKSQLMAGWTQLTADWTNCPADGTNCLENIAQSISWSILMGNVSNIADGCRIFKQFSFKINHSYKDK